MLKAAPSMELDAGLSRKAKAATMGVRPVISLTGGQSTLRVNCRAPSSATSTARNNDTLQVIGRATMPSIADPSDL